MVYVRLGVKVRVMVGVEVWVLVNSGVKVRVGGRAVDVGDAVWVTTNPDAAGIPVSDAAIKPPASRTRIETPTAVKLRSRSSLIFISVFHKSLSCKIEG